MDVSLVGQAEQAGGVRYVRNERMAGFVPVYNSPNIADQQGFGDVVQSFQGVGEDAVIGHQVESEGSANSDEGFGFFDLLDMINPFQHIPLVNFAYRAITGDEIKPISQIVGGGVFGGPMGVAGGIVNAVIEEETGRDALGNAMAFMRPDSGLKSDEHIARKMSVDAERAAYEDLPVALLGFAELPLLHSEQSDVA